MQNPPLNDVDPVAIIKSLPTHVEVDLGCVNLKNIYLLEVLGCCRQNIVANINSILFSFFFFLLLFSLKGFHEIWHAVLFNKNKINNRTKWGSLIGFHLISLISIGCTKLKTGFQKVHTCLKHFLNKEWGQFTACILSLYAS